MTEKELLQNLLSSEAYDYIIKHGEHRLFGSGTAYCLALPYHYFNAYCNSPVRYLTVVFGEMDPQTYKTAPSQISVHFTDGTVSSWECTPISGYNLQFAVAIDEEGTRMFVQTWESGLYCFDLKTGKQLWRTKSRAGITSVHVCKNTLCCHKHEKALQLLDIQTGELLAERKPAAAWSFRSIDRKRIVCQVTAKRREIIDAETLETQNTKPV